MIYITANQRQASQLRFKQVAPLEQIFTWQEFIAWLWQCYAAEKQLNDYWLTSLENQYLWQQSVHAVAASSQLNAEALAKLAQEAYQLMDDWCIAISELKKFDSLNSQWLLEVIKYYQEQCRALKAIDAAQAFKRIMADPFWLAKKISELVFYHFLEMTPRQNSLINTLQQQGSSITIQGYEIVSDAEVKLLSCHDALQEMQVAVAWLVDQYQVNPHQKIALIVPNIAKWRGYLDAELRTKILYHDIAAEAPWRFSLAPWLVEHGLIKTALYLLQLAQQRHIDFNELQYLFRSPYWGICRIPLSERLAFITQCQALALKTISWEILLELAKNSIALEQLLFQWQKLVVKKKQTLNDWVALWQQQLTQLDFAGTDGLSDSELSVKAQWHDALLQITKLLPWVKNFTAEEACSLLRNYCASQRVVVKTNAAAAIQILGVLEALDEHFDAAWLVGANQGMIPTQITPQVMVPMALQKKYQVADVFAATQLALARRCFEILRAHTHQLTISLSLYEKDEALLPAEFCHNLPLQTINRLNAPAMQIAMNDQVVRRSQSLHGWPAQKSVPGGSSALKSQNQCPMQAFGRFRLNLETVQECILGLTVVERGMITHRALQLVWTTLQSQQNLLALSEEELTVILQRVIKLALNIVPWQRRKLLPEALLALENQRQLNQLKKWLVLEKTRAPFKVYAIEKELMVIFAGQKWRLRVDRIDELADGQLLLIDYKTGLTSSQAWQLNHFSEPQLPLYCVSSGLPFVGLAIAEISQHQMRFKGMAAQAIELGQLGKLEIVDDWQALQQDWSSLLMQLTQDFVNTQAAVVPNEKFHSCQYCDLSSFCRIFDKE